MILFNRQIPTGILFYLVLLLALWLLWPGLTGRWMMDDINNLQLLEKMSANPDWTEVLHYVGHSDMHRPLALLTLYLQRFSWPGNPEDFKYVNLMIHLLVGCVFFWLLLRLGELMETPVGLTRLTALLATAVWLIHPMHISTVFYIVQRMAQLVTLIMLAGFLAYLHGRRQLLERMKTGGSLWPGVIWASMGVGLGVLVGVLFKENSVLLPPLILVTEWTLLNHLPRPPHWRKWAALFLFFPVVFIISYFAYYWDSYILHEYKFMAFSFEERILTQPRVLVDYLSQTFFPIAHKFSLYHDDFPLSKGWQTPPTTLLSVIFIVGLIGATVVFRLRAPVFAFGVLWFFTAQALESSIAPLDIYFEHRNYLPMTGLLFAVFYYGVRIEQYVDRLLLRRFLLVSGMFLIGLIAFISRSESTMWGKPWQQLERWAMERPDSHHSQAGLGVFWRVVGEHGRSAQVFERVAERFPNFLSPYLYWMELGCQEEETVKLPDFQTVLIRARTSFADAASVSLLHRLFEAQKEGRCPHLSPEMFIEIIDAMMENERFRGRMLRQLHHRKGLLYASKGDLNRAMYHLDAANELQFFATSALRQIKWLITAGLYDDAMRYVELVEERAFKANFMTAFSAVKQAGYFRRIIEKRRKKERERQSVSEP